MVEQSQTNSSVNSNIIPLHLIDDMKDVDIHKGSDKSSIRRKIEDLLEEKQLKYITQDFDFDDL